MPVTVWTVARLRPRLRSRNNWIGLRNDVRPRPTCRHFVRAGRRARGGRRTAMAEPDALGRGIRPDFRRRDLGAADRQGRDRGAGAATRARAHAGGGVLDRRRLWRARRRRRTAGRHPELAVQRPRHLDRGAHGRGHRQPRRRVRRERSDPDRDAGAWKAADRSPRRSRCRGCCAPSPRRRISRRCWRCSPRICRSARWS